MGSLSDFLQSSTSDAMLPFFRRTLEDLVYEILNERRVPTRTDFQDLRNLLNTMRSQASTGLNTSKKALSRADALETRVVQLEADRDALLARITALEAKLSGG